MADKNVVGWFEVPVEDMDRAVKFYETVLGHKLERHDMGPLQMAWFPMVEDAIGTPGSLVKHESYKPSADGTVICFTAFSGDLENELAKVESAGGKILQPKKEIGEYGYIALIVDT